MTRSTEAIDYVNAHDRPLGLYYFGTDKAEEQKVLSRTISGGATVNDVLFHNAMEDLPFGGVGPSGMGNYHGQDGFKTFSHARAVYRQSRAGCRQAFRVQAALWQGPLHRHRSVQSSGGHC
jgi:coniferyl-aldehyde dehydrogenase